MMAERFFCNLIFVFQLQLSWLLMGTEARALSLELTQLLEFKRSSVASDPSGFLTDWAPSSSNLCTWRGVLCSSDGSVVGLDLTNAGLSGTLHLSHLTSLPSLKHLYFYGNFFSAGELSPLDDASSCGLETLDLSSNRLSDGALLRDILSKCHSLKFLNLSDNKLSGSMDDISISSCENLSTLDLSGNFLSGEIPPDFVADSPPSLTSLNLSRNNLSGDFSSLDFGTCNNLTLLNLGHNGLSGTQFPVGLFECELLETLDLSHNRLQSYIPGVLLGTLENLRRLSLSYNQFSGEIPVDLGGNCGTLEELDLSGNNLSGGFPATFLSCRELWSLNLGHNQLTGDFLTTVVSHLPSLQYLYLQFNNLTGPIPPSLTNCTKLRVLDLSSNAFTGNILSGFCTSSSPSPMEKLLLANNRLQGNVPAELSKCRNLKSVDFSFNNLTGPIPLEIWTLPDISDVIMWANSLSGAIPDGICVKGGNLRTLILNNNFITGTIPPSIVNCTNMIWISLSSNRLAGEIPDGIGDLVDLAILQMGNNSLSGKIPSELGNCRSLIWLDLNSNNLSGSIPPDLANQAGLVSPGNVSGKQFAFVRNEGGTGCRGAGGLVEFEGIRRESLELYRMIHSCPSTRIYSGLTMYTFTSNGSIIYLDFSYNLLSGSIPETLGSMSYMQVLNLGHNNLTGKIPDSFGGMKAIGVLDLSHNHIEGPIPGSLGSLSFLSDLDVSNNNLSGTIPSGGQLTTFPTSRYENNSGLCGVPLLHCGSGTRSRRPLGSSSPHNNQPLAAAVAIGILLSLICIMLLTLGLHRIRKHQQEEGKKREKFIESLSTSGSSSWKLSSIPEPLSINVATFENPLRKLTFAHLLEATNGFSAESLIGSGGFGEVYKAQLKDGSSVAIKKLIHVTGQGDREFMAEMETIGKIKHRNLVPLLGYCKVGDERLLVYEYMRWGSLESVLHEGDKRRGRKLDFAARKRIAIGSARGLAFLHHSCIPHIIHRDMKSSNVLLDESFEARVSDFGMARLVNALDSHLSVSTLAGTPGYVPPEYYQSFRCTTKGDVYSYGVILLELLSGKRPIDPQEFGDDNNIVGWAKQLYKERRENEILDKELIKQKSESELCRRYLKIAFECLDDRPFRRPTMIQVMAMFKDLQVDTDGDILDEFSIKDAVIEEPQLISFNSDGSTKNFASTSLLVS